MKKYAMPVIILVIFEAVAITLWLTKANLFYLFNFSYIGMSISLGIFLFNRKYRHARRIVQLLVGIDGGGSQVSPVNEIEQIIAEVYFFQFLIRFVRPVEKQIDSPHIGIIGTRAQSSDGDFRLQFCKDFFLCHEKNSFLLVLPQLRPSKYKGILV